jgi:hypothetical protein
MLPPAEGLTFLRFVGIYLAAYAAGIAAHVPGGLGVFDGAIMLGLAPYLGAAEAVGALLVFRLFYYIIPLFIAGFLFAGFELGQRRGLLGRFSAASAGAMPLEVPVLSGLVALGGGLLIFLGALPVRSSPLLVWLGPWAALASQFAASLVGSLLLVMAFGLARRLTLAWGAALVLLGFGALIALLRDEEWWIIAAFPLVMAFLGTMRAAFYRDSRLRLEPLSTQMLLPLIAVASCGVTLAMVAHAGRVANISWWEVVLLPYAPPQLRFTVGLAALLLLVGVVRLLRPARIRPQPYDAAMRERLRALMAACRRPATPCSGARPTAPPSSSPAARRSGLARATRWGPMGKTAATPSRRSGASATCASATACAPPSSTWARPMGASMPISASRWCRTRRIPGRRIACMAELDLDCADAASGRLSRHNRAGRQSLRWPTSSQVRTHAPHRCPAGCPIGRPHHRRRAGRADGGHLSRPLPAPLRPGGCRRAPRPPGSPKATTSPSSARASAAPTSWPARARPPSATARGPSRPGSRRWNARATASWPGSFPRQASAPGCAPAACCSPPARWTWSPGCPTCRMRCAAAWCATARSATASNPATSASR